MKLPKQLPDWCEAAGLRRHGRKGAFQNFYWRGHSRYWRINCHGEFQMSERFETFDRWANSMETSVNQVPANKAAFVATVNTMLRRTA